MALFGAYLGIGDFSVWLRSVTLSLHREMDAQDRPVGGTPANELTLVFNSIDNPHLLAWVETPGQRRNGSVTYVSETGRIERITQFTGALCLAYQDKFNSRPDAPTPFITTLTISAETLSFDEAAHFAHWPPLAFN